MLERCSWRSLLLRTQKFWIQDKSINFSRRKQGQDTALVWLNRLVQPWSRNTRSGNLALTGIQRRGLKMQTVPSHPSWTPAEWEFIAGYAVAFNPRHFTVLFFCVMTFTVINIIKQLSWGKFYLYNWQTFPKTRPSNPTPTWSWGKEAFSHVASGGIYFFVEYTTPFSFFFPSFSVPGEFWSYFYCLHLNEINCLQIMNTRTQLVWCVLCIAV